MSLEAQTLAGFADLGDVVSFVHDFVSLHPVTQLRAKTFSWFERTQQARLSLDLHGTQATPKMKLDMHARIQHGISHDSGTNFNKPVFKEDNRWRIQ